MRRVSILQKSYSPGWVAFYWYPCFRTFIRNAIGCRILCFDHDKMRYFPIGRSNSSLFRHFFFAFYLTKTCFIWIEDRYRISAKCTTGQIFAKPVTLDDTSSTHISIFEDEHLRGRKENANAANSPKGAEISFGIPRQPHNPYLQSSQTVCEETARETRHFCAMIPITRGWLGGIKRP